MSNNGAAESPEAGGDALDEGSLDNVAGVEVVLELGKKGTEVLGAFGAVAGGDDDLVGEEAVPEGVAAGSAFALGRLGAGRFLGVDAVGA